jgi:hypothetical protein
MQVLAVLPRFHDARLSQDPDMFGDIVLGNIELIFDQIAEVPSVVGSRCASFAATP